MLTFAAERWRDIEREILPLAQEHWAEMPFDSEVPLSVALGSYRGLDDDARLHVTTARFEGLLVGYFVLFLTRHPHYDILTGSMDVYFLKPEFRKAANGLKLFRAMEDQVKSRGVRYLLATTRLDRGESASHVFQRLGWNDARIVWEKRLEVA